jgi:hypothetical protein
MLLGFYSVIMVSRRCISFRIDFLYSEEMHSM